MSPDQSEEKFDIVIIGAGLAGLISSILLSRYGYNVLLLEKKKFPFHKVCGEYVSNEVKTLLSSIGFYPEDFGASSINRLRISDHAGKSIHSVLDPGGFGLSRFTMDNALSVIATRSGVMLKENSRVQEIIFKENRFEVITNEKTYSAPIAIGSYGKREVLDKKLNREFINHRTGYMGVKYHLKTIYPTDEIGLDNFPGGYCGIVAIEKNKFNLCYLYKRNAKDEFHSVRELEENYLFRNPVIKKIFSNSQFLFDEPEVINEISFSKKTCVENHILLCGDSAGLITPICGNGMAMAIHAASILSGIIKKYYKRNEFFSDAMRRQTETEYEQKWNSEFRQRLFWGRNLQKLTGNPFLTKATLKIIHTIPSLEKWVIKKTHGKEVKI